MNRVLNCGAGPGALPLSVLEQMRDEMLSFRGTGMSVGELSHRSKEFMALISEAERDLRTLLAVPDNYKVLFMSGGGTAQFAAVPLNLASMSGQRGDYAVTGTWSKAAAAEASKFCTVREVASGAPSFVSVPPAAEWNVSPDAAYLYVCTNETVNGVLFDPAGALPSNAPVLVADMSSEILTRAIDVSQYGLIFAGAQKNIGIAGLTIVIVRADLLGHASPQCPVVLDYTVTSKNESLYNTPPCVPIYAAGLVFKWALAQGGVRALEELTRRKAKTIYDVVDRHPDVFVAPVQPAVRSRTNVVFRFVDAALEKRFLDEAAAEGMVGLQGHRSVGGIRVSLYNATPIEAAERVAALMERIAAAHKQK